MTSGRPIDLLRFAASRVLTVPSVLNLRDRTVTQITTVWSGARQGLGTSLTTTVPILNDGYCNPRIVQVSQTDVVASGGKLQDADIEVGPFVFQFDTGTGLTGGLDLNATFNATPSGPTETYYLLTGLNHPSGGLRFKKIWQLADKNVLYKVYLRATATQ